MAELTEKNMKGIEDSALPREDGETEEKVGTRTSNPPKSNFKEMIVRLLRIRWIECYDNERGREQSDDRMVALVNTPLRCSLLFPLSHLLLAVFDEIVETAESIKLTRRNDRLRERCRSGVIHEVAYVDDR